MIKWFKKYMFLKKIGVSHPFKASLDNKFFIYSDEKR
jgi:hypothetical protein